MRTYKRAEVVRLTGLTDRKLSWWDKTGVVTPHRARTDIPDGRGNYRHWTARAVMFLRLVLYLQKLGYSLMKCRAFMERIREMIREHPVDLRNARLIIFGVKKKVLMLTEGKFVLSMPDRAKAYGMGVYRNIEVIDLTTLWPGQEEMKSGWKEVPDEQGDR